MVGRVSRLVCQSQCGGLVSEATDVEPKGDYFAGVRRSPFILLRHVGVADCDFQHLAVRCFKNESASRLKLRSKSVIPASDRDGNQSRICAGRKNGDLGQFLVFVIGVKNRAKVATLKPNHPVGDEYASA